MRGELFAEPAAGTPAGAPLQVRGNSRVVVAEVAPDRPVLARYGAIVAAAGDVAYRPHGQGADLFLRRLVTGEGLAVMRIGGTGDVWLGDGGHVSVVEVSAGDRLSLNARHIIAFTGELGYDIRPVPGVSMLAGGLTNAVFTPAGPAPGWLALSAPAPPLVLPVTPDRPVTVEPSRVIGWSAQLRASIGRAEDLGWVIRGGHLVKFVFAGTGFVIVSPGAAHPADSGSGGGGGGMVSNIAGNVVGGMFGH